jgi:predicted O-linked N-acetylglucosamine transferase (SPINDLY family)
MRTGDLEMAKDCFYKAISVNQLFIPPYIELCSGIESLEKMKPLLYRLWNRKTFHNGKRIFQLELQLRISSILVKYHSENEQDKEIIKIYETILPILEKEFEIANPIHWQCWKIMWQNYGETVRYLEPEKGIIYLKKGLQKKFPNSSNDKVMITGSMERRIRDMDVTLIQSIYLSRFFAMERIKLPDPKPYYSLWIDNRFKTYHTRLSPREKIRIGSNEDTRLLPREKIRIGYLSPDFNNNAVGLFLTPLLKHFDKDRFEVVCYDNSEISGTYQKMYSDVLHGYSGVKWVNVNNLNDFALSNKIYNEKIDILVDLIGFGKGNRMETISMKPAPIIINYLGYPGFTGFETHRLVDNYTDPTVINSSLIKLDRSFICYHLFDNHKPPEIKPRKWNSKIRIGIFNRSNKYSKFILSLWKRIVKANRNIELWIKLDYSYHNRHKKMFSDFPSSQINFFDFQESLPEYLELFNQVDCCIDTYPYSGTTTTCAGLLMGVPTFTIYNQNNEHVSNVTGALMKWCELEEPFLCLNSKEYVNSVSNFKSSLVDKILIRDQFIKTMDPKAFMKDYETKLEDLVMNVL